MREPRLSCTVKTKKKSLTRRFSLGCALESTRSARIHGSSGVRSSPMAVAAQHSSPMAVATQGSVRALCAQMMLQNDTDASSTKHFVSASQRCNGNLTLPCRIDTQTRGCRMSECLSYKASMATCLTMDQLLDPCEQRCGVSPRAACRMRRSEPPHP